MMWPDYSCCDLCPIGLDDPGTVCENCETLKAERRRNRMMVDYETDCSSEDLEDEEDFYDE